MQAQSEIGEREALQGKVLVARKAVQRLRADFGIWARTCYRIRTKDGELVPLRLNRVQAAIRQAEEEELRAKGRARLYVLKGRQGGVTTLEQAANLRQIWAEPRFDAMTLAHTDGDTSKIFEITSRAITNFPPSLLPKLGPKETSEVSFPLQDTHFWTGTAGAKRTGRGLTLKRVHGSEFAFWNDPVGTLNTIAPALEGVRGSVVVLETTASGFESPGHLFWKRAMKGESSYRALFFPWWDCDPVKYRRPLLAPDELGELAEDEQDLVDRFGLDLEQIKWRREMRRDMGDATFFQEYAEDAESCWVAPGGMFYDSLDLKALMTRAPAVLREEMGGELKIFGNQVAGELVVIGVDTAEGGSAGSDGDRSTFVARAMKGWRLLATFASRTVTPKELAKILVEQGRRYGSGGTPAYQIVEKNAHGITVLREMRDDHRYPEERLYHRRPLDRATTNEASERIGWATTGESQPLMLDAGRELITAAKGGHASPPSKESLSDAFGVRRDAHGKVSLNGKDLWVAETLAWLARSSATPAPIMIGRARLAPASGRRS